MLRHGLHRTRRAPAAVASVVAATLILAGCGSAGTTADGSAAGAATRSWTIGNPLGLRSSVTEGIVSALGRTVNEDNGVAVPGNTVRDIAGRLIAHGTVTNSHRAHLGVEVATTTTRGLVVVQVQPGGPAARAGIRAGDLLAAVDGTATPDRATLADLSASPRPGHAVPVTVTRPGGTRQTVSVALGQYPG